MEDDQWHLCDALLVTDISLQQESSSSHSDSDKLQTSLSTSTSIVADAGSRSSPSDELSWINRSFEGNSLQFGDSVRNNVVNGPPILGCSITSPDLVICAGSTDIPTKCPEFSKRDANKNVESFLEPSLENGIKGAEFDKSNHKTPKVKFSDVCQTFKGELSPKASFDLLLSPAIKDESPENYPSRENELLETMEVSPREECDLSKDDGDVGVEEEYQKQKRDFQCQKKELVETRRVLGELTKENLQKSRECQEALMSLKELQNELMRKSMHVGSLAFAIEEQVKEKGRWFSSLRDLMRKVEIMKMEHIKLSEEVGTYKKYIADMTEMGSTIQSKIKQKLESHEDLKSNYIAETNERKELYNKVLELRGNIRVFCRCRPLNDEEINAGATVAIDFESAKDGELTVMSNGASRKTFKFDAVFGPHADQDDIFEDTAPFATSVLDGYSVCIFAYGQTGTGKTFTMEGTEEARGVNFRTLESLFDIIKERQNLYRYDVSVSVFEVYNEQIRDLLDSGNLPGIAARRLEIRQAGEGMHHVPGLVEARVENMTEVWDVLQTVSNARAVSSTNANEHSSRSHCFHCVMVKGENLLNGECTKSKLWLVDLAGSERVAKTEVQGERLKETQNINRSLSALGDVISALATNSIHIPFRNSKLTHLLQDSLGGDSKTLMFVQISPNECDLGETICSLNFASRVRGIELGPAKRQLDSIELLKYKLMAEKTKQDVKIKDLQIEKMEETIQGLDSKIKDRDIKTKNLHDKVKELEAQLLIERKLARQHVDSKIAEQQQLKKYQEEQVNTAQTLTEYNGCKPSLPYSSIMYIDLNEKENNPETAEKFLLPPKRTRRASVCPITPRNLTSIASRRNSLIPLPSTPCLTQFMSPLVKPPINLADQKEGNDESETNCYSPKVSRNGGKKISSVLIKSIGKKTKSPLQQHMRKGGVNVGMEKVRVSIGSRGKTGHRVLRGNSRRAGNGEFQQKNSQKEKERGWNAGT